MTFSTFLPPCFLFFGLLHAAAPVHAERPNVVLILADDLGYGDLGCYGHPTFKTPNLDRLAATGARLTHFNSPAAFCAPTRASLLTGRYPFRHGMTGNPAPDGQRREEDGLHLPVSEITLAQLFQRADYATGMIGKWHLGHAKPDWLPTHRGFDEYLGIPYSNDMRPVQLIEGDTPIEYPLVQANLTQRYTARAIDFIQRNQSRGFFLYLAHAMPHKPLAASEISTRKPGTAFMVMSWPSLTGASARFSSASSSLASKKTRSSSSRATTVRTSVGARAVFGA
jgi:arylsulfatase A-like enzyme